MSPSKILIKKIIKSYQLGHGIRVGNLKKHKKLIKKAWSVLGTTLESLEPIVQRRMLHKLLNVPDNTANSVYSIPVKQWSVFSQRLPQLCCNKGHTGGHYAHTNSSA